MEKREIEYKTRLVAFLDILGFSNQVNISVSDSNKRNAIYKALNYLIEEKQYIDNCNKNYHSDQCFYSTQSDCIVISYQFYYRSGALYNLLEDIYSLEREMSSLGFILRGGITIGELYHDKQNVFGPALVEAVNLEENVSKTPRVIISVENYKKAIEESSINESKDDKKFIDHRLRLADDGYYFLDFLNFNPELDELDDYLANLEEWRKIIIQGLKENLENRNVYLKYEWLANYFNEIISLNNQLTKQLPIIELKKI